MSNEKDDLQKYQTLKPDDLDLCAEFSVESRSHDPNLSGWMDVRVEPGRIGVRWQGEKSWTWIEWHTLLCLGEKWPETFRELFKEQQELAREEGLRVGLLEIHSRPVGGAICRVDPASVAIHLLPSPKKPKPRTPDGAA